MQCACGLHPPPSAIQRHCWFPLCRCLHRAAACTTLPACTCTTACRTCSPPPVSLACNAQQSQHLLPCLVVLSKIGILKLTCHKAALVKPHPSNPCPTPLRLAENKQLHPRRKLRAYVPPSPSELLEATTADCELPASSSNSSSSGGAEGDAAAGPRCNVATYWWGGLVKLQVRSQHELTFDGGHRWGSPQAADALVGALALAFPL